MISKVNKYNLLSDNLENYQIVKSKIESQEKDSKFEILDIYSQSSENQNANYTNDLKNSITNFENPQKNFKIQGTNRELKPSEEEEIRKLKEIDSKVKAHEAAHLASAGNLAHGGASFTYQIGPDGKQYAVGGEVQIALSESDNPDDTIKNMQIAQRAALAPSEPSSQDRSVAQMAAKLEAQAYSQKLSSNINSNSSPNQTINKEEVNSKVIKSNQYFVKAISKYIQGQGNIPIGKD